MRDISKVIVVSDDIIDKIKTAENAPDVLLYAYKYLFGVDLRDDALQDGSVEPSHYRMSMVLAEELLQFSRSLGDDDAVSIGMLWVNVGPSFDRSLDRNTVQIVDGALQNADLG